ncbi:MAG TPA: hypothetical protein VJ485_03585, partial [archaeon]|nr:hypothetical protein [archaeon]
GAGTQTVGIEPMLLNIFIVNPEPRGNVISLPSGEFIDLKVAVFYPDNTPVADAFVQVRVADRIVNLTYAGFGLYSMSGVRFTKDEAVKIAQSTMFIQAQDSQGNYGNKSDIELVVGAGEFNWWWFLLIPAGLAILFVVYLYMKSKEEPPKIQIQERIIKLPTVERVREVVYRSVRMPEPKEDPVTRLKREIAELEGKSRALQSAKDLAEQQYYKRQIDEATFNNLMQKYEEKLIEMDAAIRQKKKDLCQMSYE